VDKPKKSPTPDDKWQDITELEIFFNFRHRYVTQSLKRYNART